MHSKGKQSMTQSETSKIKTSNTGIRIAGFTKYRVVLFDYEKRVFQKSKKYE
jgi:hypothetical protein